MILHLNSWKDYVLSFIYKCIDLDWVNQQLCKSHSLPTLLSLSFLTSPTQCSKTTSVNAYIITYTFFFVFKKASWGEECVPLEGKREAYENL